MFQMGNFVGTKNYALILIMRVADISVVWGLLDKHDQKTESEKIQNA
jgi:hypothetical protein